MKASLQARWHRLTPRLTAAGYHLAYALVAVLVLGIFLHSPGIEVHWKSRLEDMVAGTAWRPYVLRVLVPALTRFLVRHMPDHLYAALKAWGAGPHGTAVLAYAGKIPAAIFPELVVVSALLYGSLLGALYAVRWLFSSLFDAPTWFANRVPFLLALLLPCCFRYTNYIYDFTNVLLFTLGLTTMLRRTWALYLAIFFLAVINKETSCLLVLVFAAYYLPRGKLGRWSYVGLGAAQAAIFVAVRLWVDHQFAQNKGGLVEWHFFDHNVNVLRAWGVDTAGGWLVLVLLTGYRWREKPLFARYALAVAVPLVGACLLLGYIDELRAYYEAVPGLVIVIAHSIARLLGVPIKERVPAFPVAMQPVVAEAGAAKLQVL